MLRAKCLVVGSLLLLTGFSPDERLHAQSTPGLTFSASSIGVIEPSHTNTYTVALSSEPTGTVSVAITVADTSAATVSPSSLTFTTSDWSAAQTVTVTAVDDDIDNANNRRETTITNAASGANYNGVSEEVRLRVTDDDRRGLWIPTSSIGVIEPSHTNTYTVVLESEPDGGNATVAITVDDTSAATVSPSSLTFTTSDWSAAQTVTVTAVDDDIDNANNRRETTITHTASGADYGGVSMQTRLRVTDDDVRGLRVGTSAVGVLEGGQTVNPLWLTSEPTGDVTITIQVADTSVATVSPTKIVIKPATWNQKVQVTVSGVDDDIRNSPAQRTTYSYTVTGADYDGVSWGATTVWVTDDEPLVATVPEGWAGALSLAPKLEQGEGTVVLHATSDAPDVVTVLTETLTWTEATSGTTQQVELEAPENDVPGDGVATISFRWDPPRKPATYVADVILTVTNNDPPEPGGPEPSANQSPTVSVSCDPCEVQPGGEVQLTARASDPDGDPLTYEWGAAAGSFRGATNQTTARWTAPDATGRVRIRVEVSDGQGGSASATATIEVSNEVSNEPPAFKSSMYTFELRENVDGSRRPVGLGTVAAEDPEGAELTYELASGDRERFTVGARDGVLRYVGPGEDFESGPNRYDLQVRASDPHGASAEARVVVTVTNVNERPKAEDDEAATDEDQAVTVDVLANDTDPDGDRLRVESVSAPAHGTTTIAGGGVRYTPELNYHGADRFAYVVSDGNGETAEAAVEVTVLSVNDAPEAVGVIPDQALDEGGGEVTVELSPFFEDVDGDALAYRASSSDPSVATAMVSGAVLTLSPVEYGSATMTVTAEDEGGLTATQTFAVGVSDRLVRGVVSETLVGMARSHLASVRMTLGRRATAGRTDASRLTVLGRSVPLGKASARTAAGQMLASWLSRWTTPHGGLGGPPAHGAGAVAGFSVPATGPTSMGVMSASAKGAGNAARVGRGSSGALGGPGVFGGFSGSLGGFAAGADPLRGSEFLLALGGGQNADEGTGPGRRWQVWGQGDIQTFQGAPSVATGYDGELQTGYAGVDTWVTERWLVGVAAARSRGYGNWRAGGARGSLAAALTALYPYVQWSDGATSVWAAAGAGWGEAENARRSGRVGASGLGLRVGLVELKRRLGAPAGDVEFGVRADAAWAELRTKAGRESIDGQTAAVNQLRVGAEVSLPVRLGAVSLAPFGEAHARRDGGTGQTGEGIEVAGGVRAEAGKLRVDARGRMLAVHSATGYRERGLGLTLSVGNKEQEGLSLSFSPRWGDRAAGGGALWQEQVYRHYLPGAAHDDWALDARAEYGVRLPGSRRLRWFLSLSHLPFGRRYQLGGRLGVFGAPGQ